MPARTAAIILLLTALLTGLFAGGCASKQTVSADPLGTVPSDFTIDVAVISGGREDAERGTGEVVPAELRSGRFIVFPNGDLHYASRDMRSHEARPPLTRRLTRDELSRLWAICNQSGLVDASPMTMDEARSMNPDSGEVVYILTLHADGRYRGVARIFERSGATDTAEGALVRELAALAWANELPSDRAMVIPKRYDFGPDPYERYRKP